jgi:DNA-binding winged helix-turn-helix (wHTH) protein
LLVCELEKSCYTLRHISQGELKVETSAEIIYRFGPFEVHVASGELLKQGKRIKLQEQPFRLLVILLENAGEIVARSEIQERIWEQNTFVDFDSSLRVAVRKLREALDDDADNPRYIETIPKRGYRFLGPAVRAQQANDFAKVTEVQTIPTVTQSSAPSRSHQWILAGIALLAVLIVLAFVPRLRKKTALTAKDTVVLADFANSTGDPVFDGTLRQGLAVQLAQSPFLSIISEERIQQVLALMGQPPDAGLSPAIARQVCERTGSAAVLDGSIASLGSQYVLGLRAQSCQTGNILDQEQVQAARKEDVLNALDLMASRLRERVGESLTTIRQHNIPLAEATTPSLDALKAYSMGWKVLATQGEAAALPFFKHAVEIDPDFASAYAALGLMYGATGESALAAEATTKAYGLRDRASDNEKFFITAYYDGRVTGNQEKARQTCEEWAQIYPRAFLPHSFLSGFIYPVLGEHQKGVEEAETTIQLGPDLPVGYFNLGYNNLYLNRLNEAGAALQRAAQRKIEVPLFSVLRYDIDFLNNDAAAADHELALAQQNSRGADWLAQHKAFVLAYGGRLREAIAMSAHAAELARLQAHPERAALFEIPPPLWLGFYGNAPQAARLATAALKNTTGREVQYGAALALALAGDSSRAQRLADDLQIRFPEDTSVRFSYLPVLRAVVALNHGDASTAISVLQAAAPYELATPRSNLQGFFGALYPVYVRGQAYLAEHQGAQAAAEFQKILDHQGIVISDPIGALAYLQLGRAQLMTNDKAAAHKSYETFLALWKNADAEVPIYRDAKREYAGLQ